jgi:hypothetical protein
MEPENYRFGGGGGTLLHPLVALALVVAIAMILCRGRKQALAPFLLAVFLIPKGQVVVLAGLHFNVFRLIIIAGMARWAMLRRTNPLAGGWTVIDRLVTFWAISEFVIFTLQWLNSQAMVKSLGDLLDALGGYFALRFLIQDRDDVRRAIKIFAVLAIIMGVTMINEQRTGIDVFGMLGGTALNPETRNGSIRSQGAFLHSIPAGAFGATLIPLLVWLWSTQKEGKARVFVFLGMAGATVMSLTCHSSTVISCYGAGIFALCMWPLRKQMRVIRWGISATVIGLHLVMKGPVWSLLEHIDLTGSSESFHRYQLIDTFIRHFSQWWLLGTHDNGNWGWEMADTSNQYVTYGISGGLITFALFIAIISKCFGRIGTARKRVEGDRGEEWFLWCLGSAVFAHVVVYFGIDYFDQMEFAWLALLVMISMSVGRAMGAPSRQQVKAEFPVFEGGAAVGWESFAASE